MAEHARWIVIHQLDDPGVGDANGFADAAQKVTHGGAAEDFAIFAGGGQRFRHDCDGNAVKGIESDTSGEDGAGAGRMQAKGDRVVVCGLQPGAA